MNSRLRSLLEEVFPFVQGVLNERRLRHKLDQSSFADNDPRAKRYSSLTSEILVSRILQEHERAAAIDLKTSKLSLPIGAAVSLLSAIAIPLLKSGGIGFGIHLAQLALLVSLFFGIVSVLISARSLTTLPTFGYGTDFELIKEDDEELRRALILQETANSIRQVRNEAAYQCLRNGLLCLGVALILSSIGLLVPAPVP